MIGNVRTFDAAYSRWKAAAERNGQNSKLVLSLGYFRGLSCEFSKAEGRAVLDLTDGSLSVEGAGLPERRDFDVWLVHKRPGPGQSVNPELGDRMIRAAALVRHGDISFTPYAGRVLRSPPPIRIMGTRFIRIY